jgi:hypothetical protein
MRTSEKQSARSAYSWLRASPLLTVITYGIMASMDVGGKLLCNYGGPGYYSCINDSPALLITRLSAVLMSALWHLILLQYINKNQPEFVQWHGRQAFLLAGIRTATPIGFLFIDFIAQADGCLYALAIPALILLWLLNTPWGYKQVERGECALAQWKGKTISLPAETATPEAAQNAVAEDLSAAFAELLLALQSEDDVTRIKALMRLNSAKELNDDIRLRLEHLAMNDDNGDIRKDARLLLNKFLEQKPAALSTQSVATEVNMAEINSGKPADILRDILSALQSAEPETRMTAILRLHTIKYSSEAIRNELEELALHDSNENVRADALYALDLATHKNVRARFNKIDRGNRHVLLQEIQDWEKLGFLKKDTANVLRRRYDFDITPPAKPKIVQVKIEAPAPSQVEAPASSRVEVPPVKVEEVAPAQPATPAPTPEITPAPAAPVLQQKHRDDVSTVEAAVAKPAPAPQAIPQPKPAAPPKPKQPPIDWKKVRERIADAATSGALLRALLYLGAFMIVISATVLVVRFWNSFNFILQLIFISSVPLLFYVGGWTLRARLNLIQAGTVLTGIGAILVAVDFSAIYQLGKLAGSVNSSAYWLGVAVFCTLLYAFTTWKMRGEFFDYLTLIAGAGVLYALTSLLKLPVEWRVVSVTASAAIMTGIAARFWESGEQWRELARAARYLSQILIPASVIFIVFSNISLPIMTAFLLATIAYGILAWKFPSMVFAYSALAASIGTVLFAFRAAEVPAQWYATVGSVLALAYIVMGQLVKPAKTESTIIQNYNKALNTTGFILIGLAAIYGSFLIPAEKTFWAGVIALAISSFDLAACAYLFQRSRYTLLASGLTIIPFTLAIARWLNDAQIAQGLTWLTVAWGGLALTYIAFAALLQKADHHAQWLYAWAHGLIAFALCFAYLDYLTADDWMNTPALISLGLCIAGYLITFLLQDSGKHPPLVTVSNWLPFGLGKGIFLWGIGLLLPIFTNIAWSGTELPRAWFGTALTGFALAYLGAGQALFKRAKEYRFPLHVLVYLLCLIAIPLASSDRYALLTSLLITVASAGMLAYLYNRIVETVIACLLFIWPFQLLLEIFKVEPYSQSLGYVLLGSLVYIPIAIYLDSLRKRAEHNHHIPAFMTGYALTVYAIAAALIGRTSDTFTPWIGMTIPLIATALYVFSASYFKASKYGIGWAWATALTFTIAFGQGLTLFKVPAAYDSLAWIGLAFAYMIVERFLSLIPETGKRYWFDKFHLPLVASVLVLSTLGLGLSLPTTFAAFTGNQPDDLLSPILAQMLLVILSIVSARLYQGRWMLFIEPALAFLPATLFFIGYDEKIFHQSLTTPQFALVWTGLGIIHLLAGIFLDRAKVRYAHGLYLGAYALLTWAALWSLIDRATLVWSFGLWILALLGSAVLVHFGKHQTWDEFNRFIFEKSEGVLQTVMHNAFQWLAAWTFPIWLVLFLRQINVPEEFAWLGLVAPPLLYLGLAEWLQKIDRAYTHPLYNSAQFYTAIGLLISAPFTMRHLAGDFFQTEDKTGLLAFIILQTTAVVFYAVSAWRLSKHGFAHAASWLSFFPYTLAWILHDPALATFKFALPWLAWSTVLLVIGFVLDKNKTRYSHGPYLAGYALAIYALICSVQDRVTNIYALAITITLAVISHLVIHLGRHQSFEDFVNTFWKKTSETIQQIVATIFLFFAAYAAPVLLAQILTHLKLDLAVRGVALAIAAPLFIAIGLAVRHSKSKTLETVPTWPLYSAGYVLTAIGAMVSFGDERLAIYVLILNAIVYAASAYIFQQAFWLYLSTVLTPIIALLILHNTDHLESCWVAWIFIALAYLYLLIGQIFDRVKKSESDIHPFAAPFYAPGFLLSAIALAVASSDKMLALQVYSAGVVLYALSGWLFQEALFIYPASWLAAVPYYLLITLTSLETRWYGLAWLPLIVLYLALGCFVFHKRPLPPLGKGVLVEWLSHPAVPLYLLVYGLSVSMIALSYVSPLSLTLAFAAAAVLYFVSAYLFRAPSWIYAGLFATHMTVLAYFTINPTGSPIQYITLPFLAMTWLTSLSGYTFSRREPTTDTPENAGFKFSLLNHLFGDVWSRPFFAFAIGEMFLWQTVAMKGYDTAMIVSSGHALLLALFSILWAEGVLVYGVVGFGLLAANAWMSQSAIGFTEKVAIYGGIGFGLYLLARILEPLSTRVKSFAVWLTPLTYSAIALTAASAVINLFFVISHMTAAAASLAFAGALYVAIAYRGRRYQLGYLGMALLEIAWVMALYMRDVNQPQWYAIPGGLYFMGLAYLEWQRSRSKYAIGIELLGLGILLITSFMQSLNGAQGFPYFVLLMAESLLIVWWGALQKRKIPFFAGIGFNALNIVAQVIVLVNVYNISIWLVGLGTGLIIMAIAIFVELRREQLRTRTREWGETLEKWE